MIIAANPNDDSIINNAVATINLVRCCIVLPGIDVIFVTTAANEGVVGSININVPRPAACAIASC